MRERSCQTADNLHPLLNFSILRFNLPQQFINKLYFFRIHEVCAHK